MHTTPDSVTPLRQDGTFLVVNGMDGQPALGQVAGNMKKTRPIKPHSWARQPPVLIKGLPTNCHASSDWYFPHLCHWGPDLWLQSLSSEPPAQVFPRQNSFSAARMVCTTGGKRDPCAGAPPTRSRQLCTELTWSYVKKTLTGAQLALHPLMTMTVFGQGWP